MSQWTSTRHSISDKIMVSKVGLNVVSVITSIKIKNENNKPAQDFLLPSFYFCLFMHGIKFMVGIKKSDAETLDFLIKISFSTSFVYYTKNLKSERKELSVARN